DVGGPRRIRDPASSICSDSVNLETRRQSLRCIVRPRAAHTLIVEISAATCVRDVENAVAVRRPDGTDALMKRVRQQRCAAPISGSNPHRGWCDVSKLNARVDEQQVALDESEPVI